MPAPTPLRQSRFIRVDLHQACLTLDGRSVLRGIDWSIRPSQRWILIGPNGAGKTLLLKLLAGDVWPTPSRTGVVTRRYRCGGESYLEPYEIKAQIAYLGAERQDRYEHYGWNYRVDAIVGTGIHRTDIPLDPLSDLDRANIATLLRRLKIESLARRRFLNLSYGERRLVLLARALASRPKLLLLDELFNGLDANNRAHVQHCMSVLSRSSLPWVLSTHRTQDIPRHATHLCRIGGGRILTRRRVTKPQRASVARRRAAPRREASDKRADAQPLITLCSATVWRAGIAVVKKVSLEIRSGDCWVVHGANGSGKSSFIQLLYGDLGPARGGSIVRAGIESGVPLELFKRRVGLVAPEMQALHPRYLGADEVVASGRHASIGLNGALPSAERVAIKRSLRSVGAGKLEQRAIRTLSYGQMRRVLFARALVHGPDMLLLDEPYAGIDPATRASLRTLVERKLQSGVTIVMATHHRDEWPTATSHELEIDRSRVVYCGPVRA